MSTIKNDEKNKLVDLLKKRNVSFFHACQFQDFQTYLQLGGVPSRELMEQRGLKFTSFDTDEADKTNGVWNKAFGNFTDSGNFFAYSKPDGKSIPNFFGPILLKFSPEIFEEASDVAICLRSAGGREFDREAESLDSTEEVDKIFKYRQDDIYFNAPFASSTIRYTSELELIFTDSKAGGTPEVSCTVDEGLLSFAYLQKIVVDFYQVNQSTLFDFVQNLASKHSITCEMSERKYLEHNKNRKAEMGNLMIAGDLELSSIPLSASQDLQNWSQLMIAADKEFQFNRYCTYLRSGTILPLLNEPLLPKPNIFDLGGIKFMK